MAKQDDAGRNAYFSGQRLKEEDLQDEQSYFSKRQEKREECRRFAPLCLAVLGSVAGAVTLGVLLRKRRRRAAE